MNVITTVIDQYVCWWHSLFGNEANCTNVQTQNWEWYLDNSLIVSMSTAAVENLLFALPVMDTQRWPRVSQRITIDITSHFRKTDWANKYILVAIDCFFHWFEAYALPNQEIATEVEALVNDRLFHWCITGEIRVSAFPRYLQTVDKKRKERHRCTRSQMEW